MTDDRDWLFDCVPKKYPPEYDMAAPLDLPAGVSDPTRTALDVIYGAVYSHYAKASIQARAGQEKHNVLTSVILWFGTSAIIVAVVQLLLMAAEHGDGAPAIVNELLPYLREFITGAEIVIILLALALAILSTVWKYQSNWLVNRHIAESLRLLKFQSLLSPKLWCGGTGAYPNNFDGWQEELAARRDRILRISQQELTAKMRTEKVRNPPPFICAGYPDRDLGDLIEYYLDKRIGYQKNWYCTKIQQLQGRDRFIRKLPERLFYLSVVAVVLHFFLDVLREHEELSKLFVALAVILPVVGFSIKTYRSVRQLAPVASIFISKYNALDNLERRIRDELAKAPVPWEYLYTLLYQSETLLANEHHEWLILMHEQDFSP